MSKKQKTTDNEVSTFAELLIESGIDTNLNVDIVEFVGKIDEINEKLLKVENLTLYYTIKKIIGEILQKGSIQLLDAKYLKSFSDLITTSSTILERVQNIDVKSNSVKTLDKKEEDTTLPMTEDDIIRYNRQRQFENAKNLQ
jgi:hypothetical protein